MGKKVSDAVLDAALGHIQSNVTAMVLTDAEPADRAAALAASLATITVTGGDITIANGDTSGRKITVAAKNGESVTADGTYNHMSLISGTDLLLVTTAQTSKALNNGDTVDVQAWDYEIADPS